MIDSIQRTNIDYLGVKESFQNKEYLEELNSRYDIEVKDEDDKYIKDKRVEKTQESYKVQEIQNDSKDPLRKVEGHVNLNQVMVHNAIQNIPTQDFFRIRGN
jgi:biopolymer transport protein ExbD